MTYVLFDTFCDPLSFDKIKEREGIDMKKEALAYIADMTCSCGLVHSEIPLDVKLSKDEVYGGAYWECACGSTLFIPAVKLQDSFNQGLMNRLERRFGIHV